MRAHTGAACAAVLTCTVHVRRIMSRPMLPTLGMYAVISLYLHGHAACTHAGTHARLEGLGPPHQKHQQGAPQREADAGYRLEAGLGCTSALAPTTRLSLGIRGMSSSPHLGSKPDPMKPSPSSSLMVLTCTCTCAVLADGMVWYNSVCSMYSLMVWYGMVRYVVCTR